ncbi:hypothetical protein E2C01_076596 [Portunus trituberculatus]|uniref:Uncharacterized protein n=1 Tax=Portunus trituberculatus TaxID=210409 RepID=A0A5B7INZ4_PORTR|nr:hypothetical protein [Portunus trituberculatus]
MFGLLVSTPGEGMPSTTGSEATEMEMIATPAHITGACASIFTLHMAHSIDVHICFRVLMDLLALNVPPHAILSLLREVHDKIPQDMNENFTAWDHTDGSHT